MTDDDAKTIEKFLNLFAENYTILAEISSCEKKDMEKLIKNINDGGQMTAILNNFTEIADTLHSFANSFEEAEKLLIDAANQKKE